MVAVRVSMRKYPGTKDFDSIAQTLVSNAQSDTARFDIVRPATDTSQVDGVLVSDPSARSATQSLGTQESAIRSHQTLGADSAIIASIENWKAATWLPQG